MSSSDLIFKDYVRPDDWVWWSHGCAEPATLLDRLFEQRAGLGKIQAFAATSFSSALKPEYADHIRFSSMGAIGTLRNLTKARALSVIPCHFGQLPLMLESGALPCDVALVQVSPANAQGQHSYGVTNDYMQAMVQRARFVIAEVNDQVPFTVCDRYLESSDIDCVIRTSRPLVELKPAVISKDDAAIAGFAAGYVEDGAVLQVGIGGVPDAIAQLLTTRRRLGIHSGMIGDSIVDLTEAGAIDNSTKPFDQGITVTGSLMGTRRLFQFADRNPAVMMRASTYTHHDAVLGAIPKLVTINSALEVDLTGQVNSEQTGDVYVGGTGGQVDYVRAGSRSPGGRSLIALPSTAGNGRFSRIVAALSGPVTTARSEVDVIITEFGAAELKGRSVAERAKRLTAIAHPAFREQLELDSFELAARGY